VIRRLASGRGIGIGGQCKLEWILHGLINGWSVIDGVEWRAGGAGAVYSVNTWPTRLIISRQVVKPRQPHTKQQLAVDQALESRRLKYMYHVTRRRSWDGAVPSCGRAGPVRMRGARRVVVLTCPWPMELLHMLRLEGGREGEMANKQQMTSARCLDTIRCGATAEARIVDVGRVCRCACVWFGGR
jgi:hypothetical protein